jgi:predicted CXXCH cytochrome family protein
VTVKKLSAILIATAAVLAVVLAPGAALANNGPHGGYISDTEGCAGCHRAHTAPSSVTWVDGTGSKKSALLLSDSAQTYQFCLSCHDSTSQGADTNVLDGVYEGTKFGTQGADMISGAFGREDAALGSGVTFDGHNQQVTSTHLINGQSWGAYGGGAFGSTSTVDATGNYPSLLGTGNKIVMDCGTCHDPHGSSNYRILKDEVNGVAVGGYDPNGTGGSATSPTPIPYVISDEAGYPTSGAVFGFSLHTAYPGYTPNYTKAQYAIAPGSDPTKGMTGWCIGCHTSYASIESTYNAGDGFGFVDRHRHPMNVPLSNFAGARSLVVTDLPTAIPLDHPTSEKGAVHNTSGDWIECLTCHNAHGASTVMTGFANVFDPANDQEPNTGKGGIPPTNDSALLKMNNRAVCEACHNK